MCVGSCAGITYLCYTGLISLKKDKTAVHCCDPALSVRVMLMSRIVFHVASALQSISFFVARISQLERGPYRLQTHAI